MAEAEDVLTDAARHATEFAQQLWRRHRPPRAAAARVELAEVSRRIELLLVALFGRSFALRTAQAPAQATWLARWMQRQLPLQRAAVPATDGDSLWLPRHLGQGEGLDVGVERFRTIALQQAMRASRGSAQAAPPGPGALRDLYLLLEAHAADRALVKRLPGLEKALLRLRSHALQHRPAITLIPAPLRPIEMMARRVLQSPPSSAQPLPGLAALNGRASPAQVLQQARLLYEQLDEPLRRMTGSLLWRDAWTGEFRTPDTLAGMGTGAMPEEPEDDARAPQSARLARRPEIRQAPEDEAKSGASMVQTAQPHESVAEPMGIQRPIDRDDTTASDELADALSELPEARQVATPGRPKEVLLSDDLPSARRKREAASARATTLPLHYPEWDWRMEAYRHAGAAVRVLPAPEGPLAWVDQTLSERSAMLHEIRRRFERLRALRLRLRRQLEGDEVDLSAWIEARADLRAGLPMAQRLYQSERRTQRDLAVTLLVDIGGSADAWIAADRRVIDIEREALLLVCIALEGLSEPYCVQAFSGEGPQGVAVYDIKRFGERYGEPVAKRIAGLEPQHYTRAGAALRHASATLMRQGAQHRLLILLSASKPTDVDEYEGRYGVEDMRQAVTEARLQGISTFCLTMDRQAASYLPAVFGAHHYVLLPRPERLPTVLLDWLRRLVTA